MVGSKKKKMIEKEIEEKIGEELGFIGEIGNSSQLPREERRMDETWLMVQKGLKYIPDIIDSMSYFSLNRIMKELGLDQESGWKRLRKYNELLKKGMEKTYPYAAVLMDKEAHSEERCIFQEENSASVWSPLAGRSVRFRGGDG